jgi:hypothetical protein
MGYDVENKINDLECRLRNVEVTGARQQEKIDSLISQLNSLTSWVKALVLLLIPTVLSAFGFLIDKWVKG